MILTESTTYVCCNSLMYVVHELRITRESNLIRDVSSLQHNSTESLSSRSTAILLDMYLRFRYVEKYRDIDGSTSWYIYFSNMF